MLCNITLKIVGTVQQHVDILCKKYYSSVINHNEGSCITSNAVTVKVLT